MKRLCWIMISLGMVTGCSKKELLTHRANNAIIVDGNDEDWVGIPGDQHANSNVHYAVANDNENIYISVNTTDGASQMKMLRGGVEIWINKNGKKKKKTGILFPLPQELQEAYGSHRQGQGSGQGGPGQGQSQDGQSRGGDRSSQKQGERPDMISMRKGLIEKTTTAELKGFLPPMPEGIITVASHTGIAMAMDIDNSNRLVYELKIPFSAFITPEEMAKAKKPFLIGIVINAPSMPGGNGGGNRGGSFSGGPGGGMSGGFGGGMGGGGGMSSGGGMGGGMRGGPPSGGMSQGSSSSSADQFWIRYTPAK